MKRILSFLLIFVMLLSCIPFGAGAKEYPSNADFYMTSSDNPSLSFDISSYQDGSGNYYMFLPAEVDASNVIIRYNRSVSSVSGAAWNKSGKYISVDASNEVSISVNSFKLTVMQGSIPAVSITLDSGYELDTIHNDKNQKIRTSVAISGTEDGKYDLASSPAELKTRGNSTFGFMKKPYQIKFDSKTDVFGMGKAKKWVLLANYVDGTMVRNKVVFDVGTEIGMPYTSQSVFVDLYIDGSYMGVYQLCEKVEIGDSRVPLETDYGVVVEMEHANRLAADDIYFKTSVSGKPFVYKEYVADFEDTSDPAEVEKTARAKEYFQNYINTLENELFNNGADWELVASLIDVDSFINFYFVAEFCENIDATLASTYFYMDGPGDVLHCGPLWDYDRCFGSSAEGQDVQADFLKNITDSVDVYRVDWYKMLFRYPEFVELVNEAYDERIKPVLDAEKVNASIDAYEEMLRPSLRMNHVKWVVFHTVSNLVSDFFTGTTDQYLDYTINAVKNFISDRIEFLDSTYGRFHPTLSYATAQGQVWTREYTGGCMTDAKNYVTRLIMNVDSDIFSGNISYGAYINGEDTDFVDGGEELGGGKFQGIYMDLTGDLYDYYSIEYRAYINGAWTDWEADGALVGSESGTSYISRIQARLVEINEFESPLGDANCDGRLNLVDLFMVKNIIMGGDYSSLAGNNADINGDGKINISDILLLKTKLI